MTSRLGVKPRVLMRTLATMFGVVVGLIVGFSLRFRGRPWTMREVRPNSLNNNRTLEAEIISMIKYRGGGSIAQ